jgi:hypothetical protein
MNIRFVNREAPEKSTFALQQTETVYILLQELVAYFNRAEPSLGLLSKWIILSDWESNPGRTRNNNYIVNNDRREF